MHASVVGSLSDPHSSASKCENPTWRRCSTGTAATASRTSGNIRRGPVWKSQWLLVYARLRRRSQRAVALAMFEYGEVPAALEAETR